MALLSIFTAFGLSFSAGLNAYIPLFIIGSLAHYTDVITLTAPYDTLADPWALIILGVLIIIEFLADKVPAINHVNDLIQTFFRPVAGAIAFAATAGVVTDIHPVLALTCGLLVAGGVHTVKSAIVRPAVTATTGGVGEYACQHPRRHHGHGRLVPIDPDPHPDGLHHRPVRCAHCDVAEAAIQVSQPSLRKGIVKCPPSPLRTMTS